MIKQMMLAGALLANNTQINISDFYLNRVSLCDVYYDNDNLGENPIFIYDPFTNRIAYESGYYYGQTNYPHIEQELDYYGEYSTNPITLLEEGFYPYAQSYSYDYYYFDININIKLIIPEVDARFPDPEDDLYIVCSVFDDRGTLQDYKDIRVSPLKSGGYYEYSFNIGDYFSFFYYKPSYSESTLVDFENAYRYIGLSLMDYNLEFGFNSTMSVEYSMTEWEYRFSNTDNPSDYNSYDLMDIYVNNEIILNSEQYLDIENELNNLYSDYNILEENNERLEKLNQELIQENESLKANGIVANSFGSVIKIISDNASALLETEILPNFTIGNIIFIPVIFSLIGIIFKFFRR